MPDLGARKLSAMLEACRCGEECTRTCTGEDPQTCSHQPSTYLLIRKKLAHVHVDFVGPFPVSSEGPMVDRTNICAETVPVSGTSIWNCEEVFFRDCISCFGVPDQLTSERGAQFICEIK
jgi:hypothetical protein